MYEEDMAILNTGPPAIVIALFASVCYSGNMAGKLNMILTKVLNNSD